MKYLIIFFPVFLMAQLDTLSNGNRYEISQNKLSQFFFEEKIESFRTSVEPDFISLKSDGNALFIQLMDLGIPESNIVVKTSDGLFYDVPIVARENPKSLSYFFTRDMAINAVGVEGSMGDNNKSNIPTYRSSENNVFERILEKKGYMRTGNIVRVQKVSLILKGIYVDKENIYFRVLVDNKSKIGYNIENVNFFVSERTTSIMTSTDNAPITLQKSYNAPKMIDGGSAVEIIYSFRKFTIDTDKKFTINMIETNGDRTLNLSLFNEQFSEAKSINF